MKISVLCENTALSGFEGEHGLSLFIETKNHRILFDMGQTELFAVNAEMLGIDLSAVDIAVLSHGHYDHSGGLAKFLEINHRAPVYLSRHAFGEYYNADGKYIGIDSSVKGSDRLVYVDDFFEPCRGLKLYSCNDKKLFYPIMPFGLSVNENGCLVPERFMHEQYLLIEEDGRSILISGCSHKGILNISRWFSPDVLIGGFHFMKLSTDNSDTETLDFAAESLLKTNTKFYTCHCTGKEQFVHLKRIMGDRLEYISAGSVLEI